LLKTSFIDSARESIKWITLGLDPWPKLVIIELPGSDRNSIFCFLSLWQTIYYFIGERVRFCSINKEKKKYFCLLELQAWTFSVSFFNWWIKLTSIVSYFMKLLIIQWIIYNWKTQCLWIIFLPIFSHKNIFFAQRVSPLSIPVRF